MAKKNPDWDQEKLFWEARKWNIAQYQAIVYNEYIPTLVRSNSSLFVSLF